MRILTEPRNALVKQYVALLGTEGVDLAFTRRRSSASPTFAARVNDAPRTSAPAACTR